MICLPAVFDKLSEVEGTVSFRVWSDRASWRSRWCCKEEKMRQETSLLVLRDGASKLQVSHTISHHSSIQPRNPLFFLLEGKQEFDRLAASLQITEHPWSSFVK